MSGSKWILPEDIRELVIVHIPSVGSRMFFASKLGPGKLGPVKLGPWKMLVRQIEPWQIGPLESFGVVSWAPDVFTWQTVGARMSKTIFPSVKCTSTEIQIHKYNKPQIQLKSLAIYFQYKYIHWGNYVSCIHILVLDTFCQQLEGVCAPLGHRIGECYIYPVFASPKFSRGPICWGPICQGPNLPGPLCGGNGKLGPRK